MLQEINMQSTNCTYLFYVTNEFKFAITNIFVLWNKNYKAFTVLRYYKVIININ